MGDICRDNGKSYFQEYFKTSGAIGYDETEKIKANREKFCQSVPKTREILNEINTKCRDPYPGEYQLYELDFAEKYYCTLMDSKTGKHCDEVLDKVSKGFITTYSQPFNKKYRNWDPSLCDTSCVADTYPAIIELFENLKKQNKVFFMQFDIDSSYYKNYTDNPANCCGTDDGSVGADTRCQADVSFIKVPLPEDIVNGPIPTSTVSSRPTSSSKKEEEELAKLFSGATTPTLSAQVALLSVIMCIIFALFK